MTDFSAGHSWSNVDAESLVVSYSRRLFIHVHTQAIHNVLQRKIHALKTLDVK